MQSSNSTINSVQSFMRFIVFVTFFVVFYLIIVLPLTIFFDNLNAGSGGVVNVFGLVINIFLSSLISSCFFVLPEWSRIVVLRLGKFDSVKGPGFFIIPPFIYNVASTVDTRIETNQVEATATLTKDNVPTKVTAAVEYRVEDPKKATLDVQNYRQSVIWLSTEALKNTIGNLDLKDLLNQREEIASNLKTQIDEGAAIYGIDVRAVRITDIDTPQSLVEELAAIARSRRAAEAKQIEASAEVLVAQKLLEASQILTQSKEAMKLREMQILADIARAGSTVIVYPYGDRTAQEIANSQAGKQ
jgi:regulator of protease activity HflC (stomatin/prohibitin superfamily)